jgi:hypothetical protein
VTFLDFARRHVVASILLVLGAGITIGGWVLDILDLAALGLPSQFWNIVGALIFFGSVVVMLVRYEQRLPDTKIARNARKPSGAPKRDWRSFTLEEPDYSAWKHVDQLSVAQIAHLWAQEDPNTPIKSSEYTGFRTALLQAIDQGKLTTASQFRFGNSEDWTVSRAELRRYMEAIGERPRFLFGQEPRRI